METCFEPSPDSSNSRKPKLNDILCILQLAECSMQLALNPFDKFRCHLGLGGKHNHCNMGTGQDYANNWMVNSKSRLESVVS